MISIGTRSPRIVASITVAVITAISLLAPACASSPGPALPDVRILSSAPATRADTTLYRVLERADFKADLAPEFAGRKSDHLGAVICASIVPSGRGEISLERTPDGRGHWVRVQDLTYRAEMDRDCSWWNPSELDREPQTILDHEQVHFGLSELHARELNGRIRSLRFRVDAPDQAASRAERELADMMEDVVGRLRDESTRFDLESIKGDRAEVAARWRDRVEERLLSAE